MKKQQEVQSEQQVQTEEKQELKVRELDKVSGGYGYGGYGGGYGGGGGWGGGYGGWGGGYSSAALCTDDGMGPWSGSSWV